MPGIVALLGIRLACYIYESRSTYSEYIAKMFLRSAQLTCRAMHNLYVLMGAAAPTQRLSLLVRVRERIVRMV